ncbi:exodeoxyribonuclease V subunit beta [Buchnera aphidicola (Diuraphis noxia)]|uniref:RecBCD enzyme subunit RecB n=1 Tax=Buchnera aphidicola subsp. Diuraphis noxia TaxID=118101 RepID=A0A1B2H8Z7_BUCDN|nr:exodeoxyribonuclease V subunit beta [Buchnera aphidicola]ANZ22647.1 exodeoxyribonuclease V subunit beta [Buchnera aphidicola (Diuraphis noxia)]
MKNDNLKKLNLFKIPLNGINLIEASAGTGKTFTIVLLYLRLLLGIGNDKNPIKKLLIHEILVVTFTNAAKEELYLRIKTAIQNLYLICTKKIKQPSFLKVFLKKIKNLEEAINILEEAQKNINNISIYTIHGFCKKILQLYTFDFNSVFKEKIIENEEKLYLQATQDFWRNYFYKLPKDMIKIIYKYYKDPKQLLKEVKPLLYIKSIKFQKKNFNNETLLVYHKRNIYKINCFKKIWLTYYSTILNTIKTLKINKKIYNQSNISRWVKDITQWSKNDTKDYILPNALKYFTKEYLQNNITTETKMQHIFFDKIEKILKKKFSLKNIIIFYAIKTIPIILSKEKNKQSLLGFNDLLSILLKNIQKEKYLKNLISKKYPVTFIDEFQDTNIEQYKIFDLIYKNTKKTALFLIGDPKQAIYSFRGADIFSYLYVQKKVKKHYYLDTNWRSSIKMCNSINYLFFQNKNPFIFKDILFKPVLPCCKNSKMDFQIKKISQSSLSFFMPQEKTINIEDYQIWIAKQCANEISYWLNGAKNDKVKIITKKGEQTLKSSDIAILIRNEQEAHIIQEELKKLNILSFYSSSKKSIFHTSEAQELLWILESILEPTNKKLLEQSIATNILNTIFFEIKTQETIKHSYQIIEKLYKYKNIWNTKNIFHMIKTIILDYQKCLNDSKVEVKYQNNLNVLHIAELLLEKFKFFYKKKYLITWLEKKINNKKLPSYSECIKNFDESQSVKIITIHKSKGLEYPIVWIPFSINFNKSKLPLYHNKKNFKIFFDIDKNNTSLKKADKERLAEDIRFLYVAITRSILHCSIGIACLTKKRKKNTNNSDIHLSALGYIIQNGNPMNYENLMSHLNELKKNNIIEIKQKTIKFKLSEEKKHYFYSIPSPKILNRKINHSYDITSFTTLIQENKSLVYNNDKIIETHFSKKKKLQNYNLNIHNFPSGKTSGILIHYILKNLNILNKSHLNWFVNILDEYNISKKWSKTLMSWIYDIINTPLSNQKIILSQLKKLYVAELEFFLPIKNILCSEKINNIIKSFDSLSVFTPKIFFNPVSEILKGCIDLMFFWDNKYYIIDYKSNWLGSNNRYYSDQCIKKEMIKKRYDLQYQIYTIAINKYLETRIKNYDYKNHFGGVFYIFLRGINNQKNNGVFYTLPNYSLVKNLTDLIS